MDPEVTFASPLELPCGVRVKNRFLKSAMSEQLGDRRHDPIPGLCTLYRTWAQGGVGVQVTGNVMIDGTAMGEPNNVVLDDRSDLAAFARWAEAGRKNDTQHWMQLKQPGRQVPSFLSKEPVAPSAIALGGSLKKAFNTPRALREEEIHAIIERFAHAAELAKQAGFTGVQIHGAHGYLVNQFLSPLQNVRTDGWGGSAENRRRFVLAVYDAIRARVGASYPVSIKLNSADFQRGGFSEDESMEVFDALVARGIDLIEVSGGNYEAPVMAGVGAKESTRAREAYFLEYAEKVRSRARVPLAVTGGFRTGRAMREALQRGVTDMIGLARPLAMCPDFPDRLLKNPDEELVLPPPRTGIKLVDRLSMLDVTYYEAQLARMAAGKNPRDDLSPWSAVFQTLGRVGVHAFRPRRA
jgi:2,4-dienoyl-CoA reductase-like NADH-dependent reductase (Old Yellow Enzyme family)